MSAYGAPPFVAFYVLGFPLLWLGVTTLLSYRSGWFDLMKTYPAGGEPVSALFSHQSGSLNGVSLRRILRLAVGPSGLRLGMIRLFGPFNRDVFVPWDVIAVTRTQRPLIGKMALVALGQPALAVLTLPADLADDLARAVPGHWPETGPFPIETPAQAGSRLFQQWALQTVLAAIFFVVVPRLMAPRATPPPIAVAILFPAILFGVGSLVRFLRRRHR